MTRAELIAIRKALGLTQPELARATGKGESTVTRYETGKRPIPKAFGMAVQLLFAERLDR